MSFAIVLPVFPHLPPLTDPFWPNWVLVVAAIFAGIVGYKASRTVIRAERSWVMVDLEWTPGYGQTGTGSQQSILHISACVRIVCQNDGRTPAWITEKRAVLQIFDSVPSEPDLKSAAVVQTGPEPIRIGGETKHDEALQCDGQETLDTTNVIFGVVKYRDAFGEHETRFGYRVSGTVLQRLEGYPKYNQNT
jgi:hypothetical protein